MASRISTSLISQHLHCNRRSRALLQRSSASVVASAAVSQRSKCLLAGLSLAHVQIPLAEPRAPRLVSKWREIQGSDDWEGLLEPLNPLLRQEIVRYSEFVIACYNAFDVDPSSKRFLNCKYGKCCKRRMR